MSRLKLSVAIVITTFRNPPRLANLLDNMKWAGIPDIPIYVFEDPSPRGDRDEISAAYAELCKERQLPLHTAKFWGCMQGIIEEAMLNTVEDWIIYVPDDVIFTKGALWNEYSGVLTYGRNFVGGIQAPYWNATDLITMGVCASREQMFQGWVPTDVPQNPHWNGQGIPRKYINLNGAGFSINRRLWWKMGGFPHVTWRLDEFAGYMAWKHGMVCITLPGPPRIHYFGGATALQAESHNFHSVEAWVAATGHTPAECGNKTALIMDKIPDGDWPGILEYFQKGNLL